MNRRNTDSRTFRQGKFHWLLCLAATAVTTLPVFPAPPSSGEEVPDKLSLDAAIRWALQHNPEIATLRQQHGIAAASVIIAKTYPFNPLWEAKVRAAFGPESAGVTNAVSNEHKFLIDVE